MIQGGDPRAPAWAARAGTSRGEFLQNGVANPIKSTPAASSAWPAPWIRTPPSAVLHHAPGRPAPGRQLRCFRPHVVKGIEVVDEIAAVATDWNDKAPHPGRDGKGRDRLICHAVAPGCSRIRVFFLGNRAL